MDYKKLNICSYWMLFWFTLLFFDSITLFLISIVCIQISFFFESEVAKTERSWLWTTVWVVGWPDPTAWNSDRTYDTRLNSLGKSCEFLYFYRVAVSGKIWQGESKVFLFHNFEFQAALTAVLWVIRRRTKEMRRTKRLHQGSWLKFRVKF